MSFRSLLLRFCSGALAVSMFGSGAAAVAPDAGVRPGPALAVHTAADAAPPASAGLSAPTNGVPEAAVPFINRSEAADVTVPQDLTAVYRSTLGSISLPAGFTWDQPSQMVGNVGTNYFAAQYRTEGSEPVHVQIPVRVTPRDGSLCRISPIENEQQADSIVITDGTKTLKEGVDYTVSRRVDASKVTVTITFIGNYYGTVTRTFTSAQDNSWVVPLSMESWVAGQTAAQPKAEAAHGEVVFTYLVNGTWQSAQPTEPGSYEVKASVAAAADYDGLEATAAFRIYAAVAPEVSGLKAVYRNTLSAVSLPAGFTWKHPGMLVGSVGRQQHEAVYIPETGDSAYQGGAVVLTVEVEPKNGALCSISPITDEYTGTHIVITDGTYKLVKGKDYTVSSRVDGPEVTVTIAFMGNYYGSVVRTFTYEMQNEWVQAPMIQSWVAGSVPSEPAAESKYGTPAFSYMVDGRTQEQQPDAPGRYTLIAEVPAGEHYSGLRSEVPFTIYAAVAPEVTGLHTVYRDPLSSVQLPAGFRWTDPEILAGDVGTRTYPAVYARTKDSTDYMGGTVDLTVEVRPKNGELCEISPITDQYDSRHIVITDGDYTLVKGLDYSVYSRVTGNLVTVTIQFRGNFCGTVVKTFTFGSANAWIEPLSIKDWVYGESPSKPVAEAKYGTPVFTWIVDGKEQPVPPTAPGQYEVRAVVAPTDAYGQLEAVASFRIYPAVAPGVSGLEAVYLDTLDEIALPAGFAWKNPDDFVGNVGRNSFPAIYTSDSEDYSGGQEELEVQVTPRDGNTCDISPITDEYQARNIRISYEGIPLVKGTDYTVSSSVQNQEVTVDIRFEDNFYGEVSRTFEYSLEENEWVEPLSMQNWVCGRQPAVPHAAAKYGVPEFSYLVHGVWQADRPQDPGTYTVRAVVEATEVYEGLTAEQKFTIYAGVAPAVSQLTAVYSSPLSSVSLPAGFVWANPAEPVGNVGQREHRAIYTPAADNQEYQGGSVLLTVLVTPKDGSLCDIAPITTEQEALHPTVTDGGITLMDGIDYTVTIKRDGSHTVVTITFMGNYYGSVHKDVIFQTPSGSLRPAPTQSSSAEPTASATQSPAPTESSSAAPTVSATLSPAPTESSSTAPTADESSGIVPTYVPTWSPVLPQIPYIAVRSGCDLKIERDEGESVLLGPAFTVSKKELPAAEALQQLEIADAGAEAGWELEVVTAEGNVELGRDAVVTGDRVQLVQTATGIVADEVSVVVRGDVLGIGTVNVSQVVRMAQSLNESRPLSGLYDMAGEFNDYPGLDIADLVCEASILNGNWRG